MASLLLERSLVDTHVQVTSCWRHGACHVLHYQSILTIKLRDLNRSKSQRMELKFNYRNWPQLIVLTQSPLFQVQHADPSSTRSATEDNVALVNVCHWLHTGHQTAPSEWCFQFLSWEGSQETKAQQTPSCTQTVSTWQKQMCPTAKLNRPHEQKRRFQAPTQYFRPRTLAPLYKWCGAPPGV